MRTPPDPFMRPDELEDLYYKRLAENEKLEKMREKGYLTEEGYRALRKDTSWWGSSGGSALDSGLDGSRSDW